MTEFLNKAINGWYDFSKYGKFVALVFIALLALWILGEQKKQRTFLVYGMVATVLCIFPITAAILMIYQTRFYDYQWIWALVPMTAIIAYGIVIALGKIWEDSIRASVTDNFRKRLIVSLGVMGMVFLCGSLGGMSKDTENKEKYSVEFISPGQDTLATAQKEENAALAKEILAQLGGTQDCCVWAPQKLMEQFRLYDGNVKLLYGRNMWDLALNAYSYDTYDKITKCCYWFMEYAEQYNLTFGSVVKEDEIIELNLNDSVEKAVAKGVNVIILPKSLEWDEVKCIEENFTFRKLENWKYYVFVAVKP